MIVATGKVVGGKVVLEGEPLTEGSVVTVLASEVDGTFDVTDDEERALLAAIDQAERGKVVSWAAILRADTRPQITAFVDKVIVDVKAANQKLQKESREAQQALRDLDAARSKACRRYLSVRDLVSAALREAGSDVELSKVVPPLEEAKGRRPSRGSRGLQGGGDKQASNKA